ncbi:MAG: helix-turn-helix transcriptional regulator, partial [Pseudomonadota bacterium]
ETPVRFRTRARLEQAKARLVQGDESVTDICMAVGFSSLGSFSALFARHFGQPPSHYRQRLGGRPELAAPDCLGLLRAAWERDAQI